MKSDLHTDQQPILEEELIRRAKADPEAFRGLYEKYFHTIFRFVLHRVGSREITADLTSQVFLKAMLQLPKYEYRGLPFSSWLYRIAINECNDFFRKNSRTRWVVLEETHAGLLYEEMFGEEVMQELKQKLPLILERLREDELQLIEMRFMEDRPFREIAEILDISENYAKVKTYRTLDKMKLLFLRK